MILSPSTPEVRTRTWQAAFARAQAPDRAPRSDRPIRHSLVSGSVPEAKAVCDCGDVFFRETFAAAENARVNHGVIAFRVPRHAVTVDPRRDIRDARPLTNTRSQ